MSVRPAPLRCGVVDTIYPSRQRIIASLFEPESILGRVLGWTKEMISVLLEGRKLTITSLEHLRIVLALDPNNYLQQDDNFNETLDRTFSSGLLSHDDILKLQHNITQPFFRNHREAHLEIFTRHACSIASGIAARVKNDVTIELQDLVRQLTLSPIIQSLCGPSGSSALSLEEDENFTDALSDVQAIISARRSSGWSWSTVYELWPWHDEAKEPLEVLNGQLDLLIHETFCKKGMKGAGVIYFNDPMLAQKTETLLEHLVDLEIEPMLIRHIVLSILILMWSNASHILICLLRFLVMNLPVMDRLRCEAVDNLGVCDTEDITSLKFLRATINETIRLIPQTDYSTRRSIYATIWPSVNGTDPIYIPARTRISFYPYALHTSTELWGPDADVFDPNRFLDHRSRKYLEPHPWIFHPPFDHVAYVGQQFLYDTISITVTELLRRFDNAALASTFEF